MRRPLVKWLCNCFNLNFLIYERNLIFFFNSVLDLSMNICFYMYILRMQANVSDMFCPVLWRRKYFFRLRLAPQSFCLKVGKQFCGIWICSHTDCESPVVYGLQHNPAPPFPATHWTPGTHKLETGDQTQLPAQLTGRWGQINWNSVRWGKNILSWADWSSQGRTKISCTGTMSPTNQPRKDPFHLYSLSPHLP